MKLMISTLSINSETINQINWDFVSTIISCIDTLIIIVPAIIGFIYYKFRKVRIILLRETNGLKIIIQNVSKNTIYIKDLNLICGSDKEAKSFPKSELDQKNTLEIPPDESLIVNLDYEFFPIKTYKKKQIVVSVNNHLKYRKRIKIRK